ncbi:hypothetical protein GCM10027082_13840 [Comamonas humi]
MKTARVDGRYRAAIASRALAAALGGYALAAAATAALTLLLAQSLPRVEAVVWSTMLAWLLYAMAAGWAFWARSAWSAWSGIALPAAVLALTTLAPRWLEAGL